ncbi:MAG: aldo/keto reductase [Schleiferiaceae bacterium]|nr:aldo/keto reductase [Schleiferiaceae bacterium]
MDYLQRSDEWIPKLGLGTSNLKGKEAEGAVEFALDVGYRHFDTASAYDNEQDIGPVLSRTEVPRERLFITTKVWGTDLSRQGLLRIRESFDVFNFSLSEEERARISALHTRGVRLIDPQFAPQWD